MDKVYCDECKHLEERNLGFGMGLFYICNAPKNEKTVSYWKSKYTISERPEILNAKNNCKLYEAR
jgi:hypothetical protein